MSHRIQQPSPYSSGPRRSSVRGPSVFSIVRERGVYGMVIALVAMTLGLSPTVFLLWWNLMRISPVPIVAPAISVPVKSSELSKEAEDDKPGDTALLHVACDVGRSDRWRELLRNDDSARYQFNDVMPVYVRDEQVYVRSTKTALCPFALLGQPPVSAWLPAGEYEILAVYGASRGFENRDADKRPLFPLARELIKQDLVAGQRTDLRVQLRHHQDCFDDSLAIRPESETADTSKELKSLWAAIENDACIPTPGGVIMDLPDPVIHHNEWHRACECNFLEFEHHPREWTQSQIETLRGWLPPEAAKARARLEGIAQALAWRVFFQGWFCHAVAGISGLAFARWATIAKLQPLSSRKAFFDSCKLAVAIFCLALFTWFVVAALIKSHWIRPFPL